MLYEGIPACTCPNRFMLETGEFCEVCLCQAKPLIPEPADPTEGDPFDELYFEELEAYFDDIEYAA